MSSVDCHKSNRVPYLGNRAVKYRSYVFSNSEQIRQGVRCRQLKMNIEPMNWKPKSTFDCPRRGCGFELMSSPEKAVGLFSKHYDRSEKSIERLFFGTPQISRESTIRNKSEIRISYH